MSLTGRWSGILWGTNNAHSFIELAQDGTTLVGHISETEDDGTQITGELRGTVQDTVLFFEVSNLRGPINVEVPRSATLHGTFNDQTGLIEGEWKTDLGTKGKAVFFRFVQFQLPPQPYAQFSKTVTLGPIQLSQEEFNHLATLVARDVSHQPVVLTFLWDDRSATKSGLEEAVADLVIPSIVSDVLIAAVDTVNNQTRRSVSVTFKRREPNVVLISGDNNTWVEGKTAEIVNFLRARESKLWRWLKKYGNNLNSIIFLALLSTLPSVPTIRGRAIVSVATFLLLLVILQLWVVTPYGKVFLRNTSPSWYEKHSGTLWITIIGAILSSLVAFLLNKFLP